VIITVTSCRTSWIGSASGSTIHRLSRDLRPPPLVEHMRSASGLAVLAVMIASHRINRRIPAALIGLVGSTVLVAAAGLGRHGVLSSGPVSTGLPKVGIPSVSWGML